MLPLLLLLLASFLRLPPPASPAPMCSPKTCGDLTIAYPFWLEEAGRPPCGPPSLQLNCKGKLAFLTYSILGNYQVVRVFTQNSSFIAVDHNLLPQLATVCSKWWFNISDTIGMGPFVISKKNSEVLFLYNCTKQQQAMPQRFLRTPCQNESSFFHLGGEYGSQHDQVGLPPACRLSVVPFLGPLVQDDYVASMQQGFLLEWTVTSDNCPKCIASGGQCGYANDGTGFACNCYDAVHPVKCGEFRKLHC